MRNTLLMSGSGYGSSVVTPSIVPAGRFGCVTSGSTCPVNLLKYARTSVPATTDMLPSSAGLVKRTSGAPLFAITFLLMLRASCELTRIIRPQPVIVIERLQRRIDLVDPGRTVGGERRVIHRFVIRVVRRRSRIGQKPIEDQRILR